MRHDFGYFEDDNLGSVGEVGLWNRIIGYIRPFLQGVIGAILLSLLISATSLAVPHLIRIAVDDYIINNTLSLTFRFHRLGMLSALFLGIIATEFIANFFQVIILERTGQHIMHRLRQDLFSHLMTMHFAFFNRNPIGRLVTRLTNDVQNMHEMFTSVIVTVFNDCIRLVVILGILYWMQWRLALAVTLIVPFMLAVTVIFSRLARDAFRQIRTYLARINSFLQESLSGLIVIQLFQQEKETDRRFTEMNQDYYKMAIHQITIFGVFMPFIEVISTCAVALIIWYGGNLIVQDRMTIGVLIAFLAYVRLFFQPIRELSQKYSIVQSAMASAERIFQLLDTRSATAGMGANLRPEERVQGEIEFREVSFGYEKDRLVLNGFTLHIRSGETIAIVGSTGSGKTTIINLLERFFAPLRGEILLDGHNIRDLDLQWLRRKVGLVMQEVFLFPGSIRENILLDQKLTDEELLQVIRQAQLDSMIQELPLGWDTPIGEGGMELSSGQRQLLSFARVLAKSPAILILDEATSNVDTKTEILVDRAIATTLAGRTSIIIAHRLSTIRHADRIIVIDGGSIVEEGNHESLLERGGIYKRFFQQGAHLHSPESVVQMEQETI